MFSHLGRKSKLSGDHDLCNFFFFFYSLMKLLFKCDCPLAPGFSALVDLGSSLIIKIMVYITKVIGRILLKVPSNATQVLPFIPSAALFGICNLCFNTGRFFFFLSFFLFNWQLGTV